MKFKNEETKHWLIGWGLILFIIAPFALSYFLFGPEGPIFVILSLLLIGLLLAVNQIAIAFGSNVLNELKNKKEQ